MVDEWRSSNYSIIENGQNTEKSPGDLRRLAVTQTPEKDHQLKLISKTQKKKKKKKAVNRIKSYCKKLQTGYNCWPDRVRCLGVVQEMRMKIKENKKINN